MEPFIGQIMMFGGNFAPRNWAFCDGRLLPISSFSALFSILGTTYGGDGVSSFALPDLRGRAAIGFGNGPGLTPRALGQRMGEERVTLTINEMPSHDHNPQGSDQPANEQTPINNVNADEGAAAPVFQNTANGVMMPTTKTGGGLPHDNMQPSIAMNYVIALEGIYPSRS